MIPFMGMTLKWAWLGSRPWSNFIGPYENRFLMESVSEPGDHGPRWGSYGRWGQAGSLRNIGQTIGASQGVRLYDNANDIPIPTGSNEGFALVALIRPNGQGNQVNGAEQCRIACKASDLGSGTDDFDWMLGMETTTNVVRTRFNITTGNTYLGSLAVQPDALNIAGMYRKDGETGWHTILMREDGQYDDSYTSLGNGAYTPRAASSYPVVIGANAQGVLDGTTDSVQAFHGDVLALYLFTDGLWTEQMARSLMRSPWQMFAGQRFFVPTDQGTAVVTIDEQGGSTVIITDVNTNETWQDGATGLIVTGTGFV